MKPGCSRQPASAATPWRCVIVAVGILLAGTGCRGAEVEPLARPLATSAPSAAPPSTTSPETGCALAVWADVSAARARPELNGARDRILSGIKAGTVELARASGLDIEQMTREATLCELAGAGPRPRRAIVLIGSFPTDLLIRLARIAPGGSQPVAGREGVVKMASGWLAAQSDRLVWADDLEALDRALGGELGGPELRKDGLFSMRMGRERAGAAFAAFASHGGAAGKADEWKSVVVWTGRDGKSSELRFMTGSPEAATRLLGTVRSFIDEANGNPKAAKVIAPAGFSADAEAATVALRANLAPEELLRVLGQLGNGGQHGHGPPT